MNVKEIYTKTMKFVWMRLGLGLAVTLVSILLLAICLGISALIGGSSIIFMICIWLILTGGITKLVSYYMGYMLKAAHIAVITTAVTTGQIPDNMFEYGTNMVKQRFATSNVYFVIDNLISGAVKQLQNAVGVVDNILGNIPGVSALVRFAKIFIGIALGYVDECCLGYTFLRKDEGAFKAGCDGVVIYFQNAKKLLKNAAITALIVMGVTFVLAVVPLIILLPICYAIGVHPIIGIFISIMIAIAIRSSFVDSYILVKTMKAYMEVAPSTEITFDIYGKLCKLSNKFKQLFGKAQAETPVMQTTAM